jgi:hypothetical protein
VVYVAYDTEKKQCIKDWRITVVIPVKFNQNLTRFMAEHLPDHRSQPNRNCSLPNAGPTEQGLNTNFQWTEVGHHRDRAIPLRHIRLSIVYIVVYNRASAQQHM